MRYFMKKLFMATILGIFVLTGMSVMANSKLMMSHKKIKGAIQIAKCTDCHNAVTKIEKKKGQDYKAVLKTPSCAGAGCHK